MSPKSINPIASGDSILLDALASDDSMARILDSASLSNEPILILINDPYRPTQTPAALAAIAFLVRSRPRAPRFRVVVATGAHRIPENRRRAFERANLADTGLQIEDVSWHVAHTESGLVGVAGVRVHPWLAESRFVIPIGSVEPHYFAGVTGPHKTLTIGCMSVRDIEENHSGALEESSAIFRMRGNPVFEGVVAVLQKLTAGGKEVCAIGEVVRNKTILAAAAGRPLEVLDALLPTVRATFQHRIPRPVDLLRLRVPSPLGSSFYQADKALKNNQLAVRDNGAIVLEAECSEGIGPSHFLGLLRGAKDYATLRKTVVNQGYRLGDHKAVKLRHLLDPVRRGVRLAVVSPNLREEDFEGTGIVLSSSVDRAVARFAAMSVNLQGEGLIIEDAGMMNVVPETAGGSRSIAGC